MAYTDGTLSWDLIQEGNTLTFRVETDGEDAGFVVVGAAGWMAIRNATILPQTFSERHSAARFLVRTAAAERAAWMTEAAEHQRSRALRFPEGWE